jgi:hypothetical protein
MALSWELDNADTRASAERSYANLSLWQRNWKAELQDSSRLSAWYFQCSRLSWWRGLRESRWDQYFPPALYEKLATSVCSPMDRVRSVGAVYHSRVQFQRSVSTDQALSIVETVKCHAWGWRRVWVCHGEVFTWASTVLQPSYGRDTWRAIAATIGQILS